MHGSPSQPRCSGKARRLATDTGRSKDEFVQDAMAGYFDELARMRRMLDTRYDEAINDPGQFVGSGSYRLRCTQTRFHPGK